MKKLLIVLLALGSVSAFSGVTEDLLNKSNKQLYWLTKSGDVSGCLIKYRAALNPNEIYIGFVYKTYKGVDYTGEGVYLSRAKDWFATISYKHHVDEREILGEKVREAIELGLCDYDI